MHSPVVLRTDKILGASDGTRTHTPFGTATSTLRVYQFRHRGIIQQDTLFTLLYYLSYPSNVRTRPDVPSPSPDGVRVGQLVRTLEGGGLAPPTRGFQCILCCWKYPKLWCPRRDSNSHAFRHWLLRPACLPFHHRGNIKLRSCELICMLRLFDFSFQLALTSVASPQKQQVSF